MHIIYYYIKSNCRFFIISLVNYDICNKPNQKRTQDLKLQSRIPYPVGCKKTFFFYIINYFLYRRAGLQKSQRNWIQFVVMPPKSNFKAFFERQLMSANYFIYQLAQI